MAKTKTVAVISEEPVRELSNTLVIDGNTYNINAKTVEKTNHPLVINQITLDEPIPMTFDGSSDQNINIVAAEGGRFTGKIAVPNATASDFEKDSEMVVNYHDIKDIVLDQFINNSVLYEWKNNALSGGGTTGEIKSVSIITGSEDAASAFARYNYANKKFAAYVYVADTGMVYFGTESSAELAGVTVASDYATEADHATEAEKLVGTFNSEAVECTVSDIILNARDIKWIKEGTTAVKTSKGVLYEPDGGGSTRIDGSEINSAIDKINAVTEGSGSNTTIPLAKKATQLETSRTIKTNLASTSTASFNGTANVTPGVTGVLKETNGGTGSSDLSKVSVGYATSAGSATKATQDSDSKQINKNYYRSASYTSDVNSIFITTSSAAEPSNAKVGDIWIKYS